MNFRPICKNVITCLNFFMIFYRTFYYNQKKIFYFRYLHFDNQRSIIVSTSLDSSLYTFVKLSSALFSFFALFLSCIIAQKLFCNCSNQLIKSFSLFLICSQKLKKSFRHTLYSNLAMWFINQNQLLLNWLIISNQFNSILKLTYQNNHYKLINKIDKNVWDKIGLSAIFTLRYCEILISLSPFFYIIDLGQNFNLSRIRSNVMTFKSLSQ